MSSGTDVRLVPAVVSSPKTSSAYQAHSYPTKIPPEAIRPFIEACSKPGDTILDPFCGSGMTGVAARLAGRAAILSDLSPGAVHLARNHSRRVDPSALKSALNVFDREWMVAAERQLYATVCPTCQRHAITRHTIWSEVHACPECKAQLVVWSFADEDDGSIPRTLTCSRCHRNVARSGAIPLRSQPVHFVVDCPHCPSLQRGDLSAAQVRRIREFANRTNPYWVPTTPLDSSREMYKRSALHLKGITDVRDFYLPRARLALARLWAAIAAVSEPDLMGALQFAFTNTAWHSSRMRRYNTRGGQRPLTGTLYIPQLIAEANVFEVFRHQVAQVATFYDHLPEDGLGIDIRQSSAADLSWIDSNSIDYAFTDPPFGSNIFYADCNFVWEAWLGDVTDADEEMVVNRSRSLTDGGKTVSDYGNLLAQAFGELRRVVKPDGRISVVFHNADDTVWSAMLGAAEHAGLRQVEVSLLDKVQRSMKGYKGRAGQELVPFYDLVITFSPGGVATAHLNGAGEIAASAVQSHLGTLNGHDHAPERTLEYLYSLAVSHVVRQGARPHGLSYRAFESLCDGRFTRRGTGYYL
jgi:SAM-dependent methyltransferase